MSDKQDLRDATQAFLDELPELKPGEKYAFKCYPGVRCFNACCGDLNLMLTPYDVLRLRRALGKDSREFMQIHGDVRTTPGTGFPMVRLRMLDNERHSCPFVRESGCSVYENRPGACRTYPLGRATQPGPDGEVVEQFFIVKEPHCKGFEETSEWSGAEWLQDQGLESYNASNDRYMRLMALWRQRGVPLSEKQVNMAFLALYQVEQFQKFIADMGMFQRLDITEERVQAVLANEEAALDFALDWLELILLGSCDNLSPKR